MCQFQFLSIIDCIICFADKPVIPEVDLGFVISATAVDAEENFEKMKDIIKALIKKYGKFKVHLTIVTYGSEPVTELNFTKDFPTEKKLHEFIDTISQPSGPPALEKALTEVKRMFQYGGRAGAIKVCYYHMNQHPCFLIRKATQPIGLNR